MRNTAIVLSVLLILVVVAAYGQNRPDGAALYQKHCQQCHGGSLSKAPQLSLLQIMSASSILRAMEGGVMQQQASGMTAFQRRALAEYITGQSLAASASPPAPCSGSSAAG